MDQERQAKDSKLEDLEFDIRALREEVVSLGS